MLGPRLAKTTSAERTDFFHHGNGLKYTAADRYTDGDDSSQRPEDEIQYIVVAFNKHDAGNFKTWRLLSAMSPPPTRTPTAADLQRLNVTTNLQNLKIGTKPPKIGINKPAPVSRKKQAKLLP